MRVLIVEDNLGIAASLFEYLTARGHEVDSISDGQTGLGAAAVGEFDAIVLDVRLPRLSGLELCRRLRSDYRCETPVLMLTALDALDDKLEGFAAGADDYLVKPFALKEVEARLNALSQRRSGRIVKKSLTVGHLHYDPEAQAVYLEGQAVHLPPKCIRILSAMMEAPNRTFSRAELERAGWGNDESRLESMRSHMSILRRALNRPDQPNPIQTQHGIGYRISPAFIAETPDSTPLSRGS